MLSRLVKYVRNSPVLSGGLTVYAVVGALVVLFVLGVGAGVVRERMMPSGRGVGSVETAGGEAPAKAGTAPTAAQSGAPGATGGASASEAQDGVSDSSPAGGASGTKASVAEDIEKASTDPTDEARAPRNANWLEANFGQAVAPVSIGGMRRGAVTTSESTVTAVYTSPTDSAVDSIQLLVAKIPKGLNAEGAVDAMLYGFGESRIAYEWGGRPVSQALTAEEHAETYPPAVCLVWVTEGYITQLTAIPRTAGMVEDARAQGLDFVSALPY